MSNLTKKEKKAIMQKMAGPQPQKRRPRRPRRSRAAVPASKSVVGNGPRRGRGRRGRRRNPQGLYSAKFPRQNNQVTTAGNMREFVIPIDEQIQLLSGTTGYGVFTGSINPGNPSVFPFASRTAQNYERYEFHNLRFEYRPSASVFATVGAQGFVGISATMDALQSTPSSQAQAEVLYHGPIVETARPTGLTLPKEFLLTKSMRERFFVRPNGSIPAGGEAHLYDCGQIFVWTNGQANTNQIGEIRVTGSCCLMNPVLETSTNAPPNFNSALFQQAAGTAVAATGVGFAIQYNAAAPVNPYGIVNTGGTFLLPVGNYILDVDVFFTNSAASGMTLTVNKNLATQQGQIATGSSQGTSTAYGGSCTWNGFVTSSGSDTITIDCTCTYAGGAPTFGSMIRFLAV